MSKVEVVVRQWRAKATSVEKGGHEVDREKFNQTQIAGSPRNSFRAFDLME